MSAPRFTTLVNIAIVVAAAAVFFWPPPAGVTPTVMHAGGLVLLTVGFWATQALPEHLTGLIFLLLAVLTSLAPPAVVFSGFTSATLWLVLGGLVLAEAVRSTGLGERFASAVLGRFVGSYPALVAGAVTVASVLAFLMPATLGRVLLLVPALSALARRVGFEPGSNGHTGLVLAGIVATFQVGTGVLPANAPNLALAGAAESVFGVNLIYGEYLVTMFPVLGLLKMALIFGVTLWVFPARVGGRVETAASGVMSGDERRLAVVLVLALVLWATDVLHGVRAGWVALAAGLLVLMPRVGVMPPSAFNDRLRFGPYFYVGSVLGLGTVVRETGLSAALGELVLGQLELVAGEHFRNFMLLGIANSLACLLSTNPGQPGLVAPLAQQISDATGWPLKTSLMTAAVGFSNVILPYTVPPLVVGMAMAGLRFGTVTRYTLAIAVPSTLLLLPLTWLWWHLLGFFG